MEPARNIPRTVPSLRAPAGQAVHEGRWRLDQKVYSTLNFALMSVPGTMTFTLRTE
jgi:hypothetical protein